MYRSVNTKTESTEENTQIANPAAEYCVAQGGTINIVKDEE
jgi:putative hemolysin